ncbi:class I SAM-dependent methyltransferase [Promicromonospora vindobonensis]|uniref:Class I SAM-dependent methyltransferase n=1 Tax=Promicromonospora vindobonensis TaxID=195748 RepID=A0ABW5VYH6_9MICO
MTDTAVVPPDVLTAVRTKHRALWALGNYPAVATEVIPSLGAVLVEAAGVRPGDRVLDVAAGSGNAAIPAVLAGAHVIASDLTPELFDAGRAAAAAAGAELTWAEADAHALPYADAEFDTVLSCVGVMFAPFHHVAADELLRVTRPGGTIGLIAWTPAGFIGQMFAAMKPFAPAPPPGAEPPPLWGDDAHVRALLGDGVTAVHTEVRSLPVSRFASGAEFRDFFKAAYGPTIAVYRNVADDAARTAALDGALLDLAARFQDADGAMGWDYLLLTATRG